MEYTPRLVLGKGPKDSPFVIVGEGPGGEEVKQGIPFVGPSGKVLEAALSQLPPGSFPEPYCTNVSKVRLGSAKGPQLIKIAAENRQALLTEIAEHPRKIILALGATAMWALTERYDLKITRQRGTVFSSPFSDSGVLVALHPAYLLRGGGSLRQFKADIAYAMALANGEPVHPYTPPTFQHMESPDDVAEFIAKVAALPKGSEVAGDLETTGFSSRMNRILCGGFSFDGKHVFTFWHKKTGVPSNWDVLEELKPLWKLKNVRFTWHNGKFDVKFLQAAGHEARVDDDTMLMSYALDETRGIHDLEQVAGDWLGSPSWKGTLDAHKKKKQSYDVIPPDVLEKYMAYDIANTLNLVKTLRPLVEADKGSKRLYYRTLIPASTYLADVETHGLPLDPQRVAENAQKIGGMADVYSKAIRLLAYKRSPGRYTDKLCNSPKQLMELMYDDLGIVQARGTEKNTADDTLEKLPQNAPGHNDQHRLVMLLRKYRKVQKGYSTYVKPYQKLKDTEGKGALEDDGRVHSTYLIHGTATGRLSSRQPNLQNITRDPQIKGMFRAPPGRILIEVDLNQAELRSLACLSGDPVLCGVYTDADSKGLHEVTRSAVYDDPANWSQKDVQRFLDKWFLTPATRFNPATGEDRILKEQKMRAKNVNFGIIYGITQFGLAEQIEDTPMEAQRMLNAWAAKYPTAWEFINRCRMAPLKHQNLVTVFGHKKRFGIVTEATLNGLQNEAANFPHQSTAANITLHAGIRTYERLAEYDSFFVNTVHDSNIIEAPADPVIADKVSALVKHEMEQVPIDWGIKRIPFVADREFGFRWGSLSKMKDFYKEQGWDMP